MAASPNFKIYRDGEYVASAKYAEDAAAIVANGGVVKWRHGTILWREGHEVVSAGDSYDEAARIMHMRL